MSNHHPVLELAASLIHATSKEVRPLTAPQVQQIRAAFLKLTSVHEQHKVLQELSKFAFGLEAMTGGKETGGQLVKLAEELAPAVVRGLNEDDVKRTEDRVEQMGDRFSKFAPKEGENETEALQSDAPKLSVRDLLRNIKG